MLHPGLELSARNPFNRLYVQTSASTCRHGLGRSYQLVGFDCGIYNDSRPSGLTSLNWLDSAVVHNGYWATHSLRGGTNCDDEVPGLWSVNRRSWAVCWLIAPSSAKTHALTSSAFLKSIVLYQPISATASNTSVLQTPSLNQVITPMNWFWTRTNWDFLCLSKTRLGDIGW